MAVTAKQIAQLAGVSRGTVDRVLHARGGVQPSVAQRVHAIAQQLGYTPNRAGRALQSAKHPVRLGLVLNCVGIEFYDEVCRGIADGIAAYPLLSLETDVRALKGYDSAEQTAALDEVLDAGAKGLILTPVGEVSIAARIDAAVARGIPVVTLNLDLEGSARMLHVGCDYAASGRTAAALVGMLTGGHARVAVVTGSLALAGHSRRVEGFTGELCARWPGISVAGVAQGYDDDVQSYAALRSLLETHADVTAVYFTAAGVRGGMQALHECFGDALPPIVACDDTEQNREYVRTGRICALVCQQAWRQGYEAARGVLEALTLGRLSEPQTLFMENQIKIAQNL